MLERAGGDGLARAEVVEQRLGGERPRRGLGSPRARGCVGAVQLGRGGRVLGGPGHVGERAGAQLRPLADQVAHVVHEVGLRLRVPLLVARAGAEHQQALGARGADVEEVALAVEPVLSHGEDEPGPPVVAGGGGRDRAAVLVREERLRRGTARELALLEPAREHHLEAARANRLGGGHLHAVGLRRLAHVHLQLLEHPQHAARVRALAADHRAQLPERLLRGSQRARLVDLRAAQHGGVALVWRGEQPHEPRLELGRERRGVAGTRKPVQLLELPVVALPERPRLLGAVRPLLAHIRLEPVREAGHLEQPGSAEICEQVVGRAGRRCAADQPQQAAAEPCVAEAELAVDRVGDSVGAEDLLDQRRVARRLPEHHRHVARLDARPQQLQDPRGRELHLGSLPSGRMERDRSAGVDPRGGIVLEQQPLDVVKGGARLRCVVVVDRGELVLLRAEREQLLVQGRDGLEGSAPGLEGERDSHVGVRGDGLERIQLNPVEVIEAVHEQRGVSPRGRAQPRASRARHANSSSSASPAASSPSRYA